MDILFGKNKKEQVEPVRAKVTGTIPAWLQGMLLRNGPGMHTVGETRYNHWFDGLALLHSFTIRDGEVCYRSRYLRSDTYSTNIEANRIVVSEFGTMAYPDPCKNIFSKAFSYLSHTIPNFTDNCLINIMKCGEDFYATTETNYIRRINPQTLETLEKVDYRKYVAINLATSHPHYDEAGNILNMGTSIVDKGKTKYVIFKIPAKVPEDQNKGKSPWKHTEVFCSIPSRSFLSPSYYHSFGVTENYIIFLEQPFKLDILKMATAYMRGVSWASCLTFHREEKNAEVGSNLIKVACTTATAVKDRDDQVYCQPELLYEGLELPRINYAHNGKQYRYIFAAEVQWSPIPTKIIKYDTLTKSSLKWGEENCWPAEPLFVPTPGATDEDDGVILSTIVSTDPPKLPFLLILDAKNFTELARASVEVEMHLDLHGLFIPDAAQGSSKQPPSEERRDRASHCDNEAPHT
ncbi:beta,beta-carotene 15,15'-dioxygenase isoform X2 [Nycticebus coucang]|uniref:beta,beta-carotene 15,15'-dioxygenase isoform X2 n=1 Tax=Nycticebus coucang TaxID=9470 RepID=UPI00234C6E74|nr:beta,beta-carotene 15,15'-dioxygenase isoform X2 [Nycticebus coucang]